MARVRVDDKPRTRCVSMDMLRGGNKSQPRGDNSIDKYRYQLSVAHSSCSLVYNHCCTSWLKGRLSFQLSW